MKFSIAGGSPSAWYRVRRAVFSETDLWYLRPGIPGVFASDYRTDTRTHLSSFFACWYWATFLMRVRTKPPLLFVIVLITAFMDSLRCVLCTPNVADAQVNRAAHLSFTSPFSLSHFNFLGLLGVSAAWWST